MGNNVGMAQRYEHEIPEGYEVRIDGNKVIMTKKDSEDERIRQSLVEYFRKFNPKNMWDGTFSFGDVLSYLERQKDKVVKFDHDREQKPAKEDGPFDEDKFLEGELAAFLQNYDKEYDDDAAISDVAIHFYELGKKMTQKPAEYITISQAILDYVEKNKPRFENRMPVLGDMWIVTGKYTFPSVNDCKPVVEVRKEGFGWMRLPLDIVKITKPANALQTDANKNANAEWSEEDETAFGDLMWCIKQARKSAKDENDMGNIWFAENWVKNRLKSLRPQLH